ncbi:tetratricopeptide repeat protein [Flavobacterium qiangtangense]|uniref:Oxygen sensor histidine kinase NreB n=1 Tax=Flavobacterium qiangtangense TaxID=1442595 RepID=A0ABW1PRE3_9FLAO
MKKNYPIFFILGLLLIGCTKNRKDFSDSDNSDSLAIFLSYANEDSVPFEKRLNYNDKALSIILDDDNDSLSRANLFKVANRYFNMNKLEKYEKTSKLIIEKAKAKRDTASVGKAYVYLGDFYANTSKKDSAFSYYTKAQKIYQKLNDVKNLGGVYISMALVQADQKDYLGGELSAIKALNVLRESQEKPKIYEAYNILGYISNELQDYEKSLEYHTKALNLAKENNLNEFFQVATSLNNIGNVYQNQGDYESAISNFNEALRAKNLFSEKPNLYAILLDNLGYSTFKLSENSELPPELFNKSLKIRDSLNLTFGEIYSNIHLSEYYAANKDTSKAKKYAQEALRLAKETKRDADVLMALKQAGTVEPENASIYSREYIKINDSLQNAERKIKDKFARIEFETNEIIQEKDKLAEQNRNMIFFFGLAIMIGILLFVIRSQRARTKELLLKQAQQKANEDIYNLMLFQQAKIEEGRANEKIRIAQELHDGILGRLFGARLNLDSLNKRQDEAAIDVRNTYLVELKSIEQDIREISHDLNREKSALNNNFVSIVNNLIDQQENLSDANVSFLIDPTIEWEKLENTVKINLYRILQESLQNINKYAQAENIKIEIKISGNKLKLVVKDDGNGFSVSKKNKGIGLQNMLSRAEACNGNLDIKSKPGKGTTITIAVPIETNIKTE